MQGKYFSKIHFFYSESDLFNSRQINFHENVNIGCEFNGNDRAIFTQLDKISKQ